jgi:hypothetical protein
MDTLQDEIETNWPIDLIQDLHLTLDHRISEWVIWSKEKESGQENPSK